MLCRLITLNSLGHPVNAAIFNLRVYVCINTLAGHCTAVFLERSHLFNFILDCFIFFWFSCKFNIFRLYWHLVCWGIIELCPWCTGVSKSPSKMITSCCTPMCGWGANWAEAAEEVEVAWPLSWPGKECWRGTLVPYSLVPSCDPTATHCLGPRAAIPPPPPFF